MLAGHVISYSYEDAADGMHLADRSIMMYTMLATLIPCTMMLLALVCTYIATLYTVRACEQGEAPHYSDAEEWATDLEWDLMSAPEAPCPVMGRAVSMGLLPDPWAMPTLLARLGLAPVAVQAKRISAQRKLWSLRVACMV